METLQIYNLTKRFGKKEVLNQVSLTLQTGDILGLFGRNGCGKSTLLKIIFGTLAADSLTMDINGENIYTSSIIPRQLIGCLPQHPFLPGNLLVRDVIPLYFKEEKEQDALFYNPLIATISDKKINTLSIGQQKYLEILLIGNLKHPFLFLDEPFTMLEPLQIKNVKSFIQSIASGKGIFITDHYYSDVLEIATTTALLSNSSLIFYESKALLVEEYLKKETN